MRGRDRRRIAGKQLADLMTEMMFATSNYRRTLFEALLDARRVHGGRHVIAEDIERKPITYTQLLIRSAVLGDLIARATRRGENVGVLLPNALVAVVTFFGLQGAAEWRDAELHARPTEPRHVLRDGADRAACIRRGGSCRPRSSSAASTG